MRQPNPSGHLAYYRTGDSPDGPVPFGPGSNGVLPFDLTEQAMLDQASNASVAIGLSNTATEDSVFHAIVTYASPQLYARTDIVMRQASRHRRIHADKNHRRRRLNTGTRTRQSRKHCRQAFNPKGRRLERSIEAKRWGLPKSFMREQLHSLPEQLVAIESEGDNMAPTIASGALSKSSTKRYLQMAFMHFATHLARSSSVDCRCCGRRDRRVKKYTTVPRERTFGAR
jgi:hypothetical protein